MAPSSFWVPLAFRMAMTSVFRDTVEASSPAAGQDPQQEPPGNLRKMRKDAGSELP